MASVIGGDTSFSVRAYPGDAKTLLAFNLDPVLTKDLAGFTVQVKPEGHHAYTCITRCSSRRPPITSRWAASRRTRR